MTKTLLTHGGLQRLNRERVAIIDEIERLTREMGVSASIDNDLRENPEFLQLRTKVTYELPRKIAEIDKLLANFTYIKSSEEYLNHDKDTVVPGSRVHLTSDSGDDTCFIILGAFDSDPERNVISYQSPLAQKLLGLVVNDELELKFGNKSGHYTVKSVHRVPISDL